MQLHTLKKSSGRVQKRVGRGGKRGTTAGRGTKGQRSRSGRRIRPAVRDLIIRLPKLRGFRNKPKSDPAFVLALSAVASKVKHVSGKDKVIVDKRFLKEAGLLPLRFRGEVKILGGGEAVAMNLKGIKVSASVKSKIEAAGGSVGA